ncbi:MAG: N-acetylmuramoyl-L-alanine amidase, partial [Janthinobacterium sp.]
MKYFNTKLIIALVATVFSVAMIVVASADDHNTTKGGELVIENPTQSKKFHIASVISHNNDKEFVSNSINTDFPFNAVAFSWNAPQEAKIQIYTRFQKESWSDWQLVERDIDVEENDSINQQTSSIIFTPYTNILQYKIVFEDSTQSDQIKNLKINYIDSTKGGKSIYTAATVTSDSLNIIPRSQWGADESIRFDAAGEESWPKEYYTPQRFIIHHTDSSDVSNPTATVRAIYYFHAKSHNWGDIGYNYLIDNQGNIYEGRNGGDAVTGAHAAMNNRGSIGIAILGCYHPASNCSAPGQLTPAAHNALERLIAVKSQQFNIDPSGLQKTADGKTMPTVVGHRDVGHSNCPGDNIYTQLGVIKTQSNVQLASLAPL